jgi:hypothetical protein
MKLKLANKKRFTYNLWGCGKFEGEGTFIQNCGGKIVRKTEQLEDQGFDNTVLLTLILERLSGKCKLNVSHDDTL